MLLVQELKWMLSEIEEKQNTLAEMVESWESGDPLAAAVSDPSDQYVLSEEIKQLWDEFKEFINTNIN